jgi:hypothetical protein
VLSLFELARSAAVLDAVEGVLGPDILCWGASLFVKEGANPAAGRGATQTPLGASQNSDSAHKIYYFEVSCVSMAHG